MARLGVPSPWRRSARPSGVRASGLWPGFVGSTPRPTRTGEKRTRAPSSGGRRRKAWTWRAGRRKQGRSSGTWTGRESRTPDAGPWAKMGGWAGAAYAAIRIFMRRHKIVCRLLCAKPEDGPRTRASGAVMRDTGYGLRRILLLRRWVNSAVGDQSVASRTERARPRTHVSLSARISSTVRLASATNPGFVSP